MQDLVSIFRNAAILLDYIPIIGAKKFLNYDLSNSDVSSGKIVIAIFPLIDNASDIINGQKISKLETSTTFWLGRKFDNNSLSGTMADLDETYEQKYDRRLFELKKLLISFIETSICGTDLELTYFRMSDAINESDENLDFISADIRIRHAVDS